MEGDRPREPLVVADILLAEVEGVFGPARQMGTDPKALS
jgi:hypothetical protein